MQRMKKALVNSILAICSIAATGLLVVALDRAVGLYSPPSAAPAGLLFEPYSSAHYDTIEFDCTPRINNLGFRGEDTTLPKTRKIRVVALGDSYTFGWGVDLEDTWVKRVETALRAEGRDIEILNLGVPGHGPGEYANTAERVISILKPDLVLVGLLQGNDLEQLDKWKPRAAGETTITPHVEQVNNSIAGFMSQRLVPNFSRLSAKLLRSASHRLGIGKPTSISDQWKQQTQKYVDKMSEADRQQFYKMSAFLLRAFQEGKLNPAALTWLFPNAGKAAKNPSAVQQAGPGTIPAPGEPAAAKEPKPVPPDMNLNSRLMRRRIDLCAQQLERIKTAAEQTGARVVVASIPQTSYVQLSGWQMLFHSRAAEDARQAWEANFVTTVPYQAHELASAQSGIPMVHVTAAFREASRDKMLFFEFDGHFTVEGNRIFADLLTPALRPYLD